MPAGDPLFARFGRTCPAGTVLFREGEEGNTMFVLSAGKVRISKEGRDGTATLAVLEAGEFFGEMAILNDKPRTATAEVVEDAQLLEIDAKTFGSMVISNSEIAVRLIKRLARRLDAANALIDILLHNDPKARVILGLAREAEFNGVIAADGAVHVRLDRAGLARQVGIAEGEVARVMARLSRLSIAHEQPGGFVIPDRWRLEEFLEFLHEMEDMEPGDG